MPISFPSLSDITARVRSDIRRLLPSIDPTIFGSFVRAFSDSNANRHYDNVLLIQQLAKQQFPQTADEDALERWAEYEGLSRFPSTGSDGPTTATGTAGSTIPNGTALRSAEGDLYSTTAAANIVADVASISSLTRSGSTVTSTTTTDHSYATGIDVTIAGAIETDYNGTHTITVTGANEYQYEISATPTTPATGTITSSTDIAVVTVESDEFGVDKNLLSGALLTLVSPIAGVDAEIFVQLAGLTGGADEETDESLLNRTLQSRSNPVANYNVAAIEKQVLSVPGVTRVEVKRITPYVGGVTVLFVRDGDDNIIPDTGEVQDVEDAILEILPANSATTDLFVKAPTPVSTDYTFSAISPDTSTMRAAIEENLVALYEDEVTFETDITEDKYRSAIIDSVDPETGDTLQSFTLTTPTADIVVGTDEIGVLGSVTFS